MNNPRSPMRMGLAVLSGGMAFVGSASAAELIVDGNFENTTSVNGTVKAGGTANPAIGAGWSTFSTYLYSTKYAGFPGPANSGAAFLRPYPSGMYGVTRSSDTVQQRVSLTGGGALTTAKIDAGQGQYRLAGWFSGYRDNQDYSDLTLEFLNAAGEIVGESVPLAGLDFYAAIPFYDNTRYSNAREWVQDSKTGTIPTGARTARVTIHSTNMGAAGQAPDGYVDLVSLDVSDASAGNPTISEAIPGNNSVGAGPVVDISVTIQDRAKAVDSNTVQLYLDNALVAANIQKVETNTFVKYTTGLLPALSQHTYKIIFADNGSPSTKQTNEFKFTVADYLTLPLALKTPLGSEDATKPGFNVNVYQLATLDGDPLPAQRNIPSSVAFAESVLAGLAGENVADLTAAAQTNRFEIPDVINWIGAPGLSGNIPNDTPFPGIPGTTGFETSFVDEIRTYIRFPVAGYYEFGINNDDFFRLTAGTNGVQTLRVNGANGFVIPTVPIATNITQLQFGGALPTTPLTGTVIYATPSGDPTDACDFTGNTTLAGKIVLLDLGAGSCQTAEKVSEAQNAGAIAVIGIYSGDPSFPRREEGIEPSVTIPFLVIAENFGGSQLKTLLSGASPVSVTIQTDTNPRLAEWDAPKGFGAVDVNFGFAVPEAGVYPFRLIAGQEAGESSLEWYQILPGKPPVLLNDTSNPDALRTFRARTESAPVLSFNAPSFANGKVTLSWQGSGTLEETTSLPGTWSTSPSQANPQTVDVGVTGMKFYRLTR